MDPKPQLYYFLLGANPPGRHTEQHDVFFCIADSLQACIPLITAFWPEAKGKIHIDAWQVLDAIPGYEIKVVDKVPVRQPGRLFFINLGGYKSNVFDEMHERMIIAAPNMTEAKKLAKKTAFYKDFDAKGIATSHIDNKYGLDVDDAFDVEDILPQAQKEIFSIELSANLSAVSSEINIGYLPLRKIPAAG